MFSDANEVMNLKDATVDIISNSTNKKVRNKYRLFSGMKINNIHTYS